MRLTFVLESFCRGGKERRCLQLIQGLNKMGISDIQLVLINDGIEYEELYDTTAQIERIRKKEDNLTFIKATKVLKNIVKDFRPDIVLSWGVLSGFMIAFIKPFIKSVYLSAFVANVIKKPISSKEWWMRKIVTISCKKVVGNSQVGLKAYSIPTRKGVRILNGFNIDRLLIDDFDRDQLRIELAVNTKYLVVMLARFHRRHKDYQSFINVAKQIGAQRRDVTFIGIGGGDVDRTYYNSQLTASDKEFIHLLGYRKDIEKILKVSDISMLLSNPEIGEGISNTIMESMAFGVPVIATLTGGTPEIIEDGFNGFMVKDNSIDKIVELTNILLDNRILYETISKNAERTIKNDFSLERMTEEYLELFRSVME